jgi:hypothetical protein
MVRFQSVVGTVLGLGSFVHAVPQNTTPFVNTPPASATATATEAPTATPACALAANEQAAYFSANPNGKQDVVPGIGQVSVIDIV